MNINKLLKNRKCLFLAYDQGLEHGPTDFNDKNSDPLYIIDIAKKGNYNGVIFQKGIAEKYQKEIKESKIPLILKLNGKTKLVKGEPISRQLCTVEEAIKLGAKAVGYTIYIGSKHEPEMLKEAGKIQREAHKNKIPLMLWIYPRGSGTKGKKKTELMAYSVRVALELGADIVKVHPQGKLKDLEWTKKVAGRIKIVASGGSKIKEKDLLKQVNDYMKAGFTGLAIGRNVWQSKDPLDTTKKIKKIIWKK